MVFRFIIIGIVLLDAAFWYWAWRRLRPLDSRRLWRSLMTAFVGLHAVCLAMWLLNATALRTAHGLLPAWVVAAVMLWHLLVLPLWLIGFLAGSLGRLGGMAFRFVRGSSIDPPSPAVDCPTRRQVLAAATVAVPPLILAGAFGRSMTCLGTYRVRHIDVPIPQLPSRLQGFRIVHLSDSHVGRFSTPRLLSSVIADANALDADVVLFTGDLIDFAIGDLPEAIDFIRRIRSRYGLAMCLGNHDLIESRSGFIAGAAAARLPLLVNSSMPIDVGGATLDIWGVDWARGENERADLVRSLRPRRSPDSLPILLAHHPHCFDAAAETGFALTLSGHTHGGGVMFNDRIGAGSALYRYWSGLYRKADARLVVSNGVGNWFPLRINAPAEITHITLHRDSM